MFQGEQVKRGAALLDEKKPGWEGEIDLDHLDMLSASSCILGQLYGEYGLGLRALSLRNIEEQAGSGFLAPEAAKIPELLESGSFNLLNHINFKKEAEEGKLLGDTWRALIERRLTPSELLSK